MWKKIAPLLIVLSVALNLAFAGGWAMHAVRTHWTSGGSCGKAEQRPGVGCPLHQKLGTSQEQWKQIEPRLAEFCKASQALCQEVTRKRREMIDLLSAPQPDRQAIAAKQEEILAGQRRVQQLVIEHLLAEKQILTAQQQQELFDLLRTRSGCASHGPVMMGLGVADEASSRPCAGTCPSE